MTAAATAPATKPRTQGSRTLARWFFPFASLLMLVLMLWGFRHFYFHGQSYPGRPITPPIRITIITHGISMAAWVLLLNIQSLLIAGRKHKLHMKLGMISAFFALIIIGTGVKVGLDSARVSPPDMKLWTLTPPQFMTVTLGTMLLFTGFVAVGVWKRRKPDIHKPMMLLGTLAAMGAAISRIDQLSNLYIGTPLEPIFGPFLFAILIGLALLILHTLIHRKLNKAFAIGLAALTLACLIFMQLGPTPAWENFARSLI